MPGCRRSRGCVAVVGRLGHGVGQHQQLEQQDRASQAKPGSAGSSSTASTPRVTTSRPTGQVLLPCRLPKPAGCRRHTQGRRCCLP
jgi:hypothetical protein